MLLNQHLLVLRIHHLLLLHIHHGLLSWHRTYRVHRCLHVPWLSWSLVIEVVNGLLAVDWSLRLLGVLEVANEVALLLLVLDRQVWLSLLRHVLRQEVLLGSWLGLRSVLRHLVLHLLELEVVGLGWLSLIGVVHHGLLLWIYLTLVSGNENLVHGLLCLLLHHLLLAILLHMLLLRI